MFYNMEKQLINHLLKVYKEKRYNVISERMIEVDDKTVSLITSAGRQMIGCSCQNSGRFAHSQLCWHKRFFILFPYLDAVQKELDELINYYNMEKQLTKDKEIETKMFMIVNDLENLKRLKID